MAQLLDTASLITDAEQFNKSSSTAAERVKLLQFAQDVEAEVLAMRRWWFLWARKDLSWTNAEPDYALPVTIASIDSLSDEDGLQLTRVSPAAWRNVYRKSTSTGVPTIWAEQPRNPTTQVLNISVWPTPITDDGVGTATYDGRLYVLALVDSVTYSIIPEEFRPILSLGMHEKMAMDEEKVQLDAALIARRDALIAAMITEDVKRGGFQV